jgi:predicted dehydrogenase
MPRPKVLLLGAGRFGRHYLRLLKALDTEGRVALLGVVVRSKESAAAVAAEHALSVWTELSDELLGEVDAVFIATPPESHAALAARCLPHAHVYVEKPVAMTANEADKLAKVQASSGRLLMVGHILRFHPMTRELMARLGKEAPPRQVVGQFINPLSADQGRDSSLEFLHLFDVLEAVWPALEVAKSARRDVGRLAKITLRFASGEVAHLELGWHGEEKARSLSFLYPDRRVVADFVKNTLTIYDASGGALASEHPPRTELLRVETEAFLAACGGQAENPVPLQVGRKIVAWAERVNERTAKTLATAQKPRVAVIGGGLFGINAAVELSPHYEVTLFERNNTLLREGAWANNFRHHTGYHYPRSDETVRDVEQARALFEERYGEAILKDVPNYYGIARVGSHVDPDTFLEFCERHRLPYELVKDVVFPQEHVALTVKVEEPSYHYDSLARIAKERLKETNVRVRLGARVTGAEIVPAGEKRLTVEEAGRVSVEEFDTVINATYAAVNWFTHALGVAPVPVRVDWAEVPILHLKRPPISLTVIDGPFACVLPTGNPNEFTLYHVVESVLERYTPKDGLVRPPAALKTNALAILERSLPYYPFLKEAVIKGSRQVYRGVQAFHEHDDSRVAEIYDHGFDCYSLLSGKIVSSVALAKRLAAVIRRHRA